jgi:hypothetical protein
MARYGKSVKIIENLLNKAFEKTDDFVSMSLKRQGNEVYRIEQEIYPDPKCLVTRLFHYGTLTLEYNDNEIVYYYGYSNSDRDSLNTMLDLLGHNNQQYFKLSQGEIILVTA